MSVSKTSVVAYTISFIELDVEQQYVKANFIRTIDGAAEGSREMLLTGQDMVDIVNTAAGTASLGDQVTAAIYAKAIAKGVIEGTVT
jgi:hypothetical protein